MARAPRLLDLIQALRRRRRPVAAAVLAEELGVSPRTLYRDIATLVAQGIPIDGEAGLGSVLRAGAFLPPPKFDAGEVDALILRLRFVIHRGDEELAQEAASPSSRARRSSPGARRGGTFGMSGWIASWPSSRPASASRAATACCWPNGGRRRNLAISSDPLRC